MAERDLASPEETPDHPPGVDDHDPGGRAGDDGNDSVDYLAHRDLQA